MNRNTDDKTVIEQVLSGNTDAYSVLVERYEASLYRAAVAIIHDAHDAEDILQDAFVAAYIKLNTLADPMKFYPWILRIVQTRCYNYISRVSIYIPDSDEDHPDVFDALTDDGSTPEESYLTTEKNHIISQAIAALPPRLYEVAHLFFVCGVKQTKIANRLCIPIGTVKRRIHDSKIILQKELRNLMNEYTPTETSARPRDGFSERVSEKIKEIENYKAVHGSAVGYGDAYRNALSLITELSDRSEAQRMETRLINLVYYDKSLNYEERMSTGIKREELIERARKNNDPLLIADLLTDMLNEWDFTPEASAEGIEYIEKVGLSALRSMPESHAKHAAIGKIMFWGHYCSYLTVFKDFPKARAALSMAIAEMAPHAMLCEDANTNTYDAAAWYTAIYTCMLAAEKALGKIEARGSVELPYKVQVTSQSWLKTADNIRLIFEPGCSYYNQSLGWYSSSNEKYHCDPLMAANWCADEYFFTHTAQVGIEETIERGTKKKQKVKQCIVSKTERVDVPAGTFENCLHIHRTEDDGTFHDFWYADGVGLLKYEHNSKTYGREEGDERHHSPIVLESYHIKSGTGYLPASLGNKWRYVCEGAPEDIEAYAEYEVVLEAGDMVYLTCVMEYIDPKGGPGFSLDD